MLDAIAKLAALGPLPSSESPDIDHIEKAQQLIDSIIPPIGDDDARGLISVFGPDECFGLAWSILHLIETAPSWPLEDCLKNSENEWIERLKRRVENRDEASGAA